MKLRAITDNWYEAVQVGGYGCKLNNTYASKREAQKAIAEANLRVIERGYGADEYYIMYCSIVRLIEDNGDVVSETITRVRV